MRVCVLRELNVRGNTVYTSNVLSLLSAYNDHFCVCIKSIVLKEKKRKNNMCNKPYCQQGHLFVNSDKTFHCCHILRQLVCVLRVCVCVSMGVSECNMMLSVYHRLCLLESASLQSVMVFKKEKNVSTHCSEFQNKTVLE
jgi:hypothetical protein